MMLFHCFQLTLFFAAVVAILFFLSVKVHVQILWVNMQEEVISREQYLIHGTSNDNTHHAMRVSKLGKRPQF